MNKKKMILRQLTGFVLNHSVIQLLHRIRYGRNRLEAHLNPHRLPAGESVFILSTGRTGTETLAALAGLEPSLYATHEPKPLLYALSRAAYEKLDADRNMDLFTCAYWTARIDLLSQAFHQKRVYLETSPQSTFLGPVIHALLPNAKFIHLVRNPIAVVRSGMRRKWFDGHVMDSTRIEPSSGSPSHEQWQTWDPFEKNLWLWRETNQCIRQFLKGLPAEQSILMQAEKIFAQDRQTLNRYFTFLGAPVPSDRKIHAIIARNLNAQTTGSFPPYDRWSNQMQAKAKEVLGSCPLQMGYTL